MKKVMLVVAVVASLVATQSCKKKKDVVASTTVAPTASISGTLSAETDLTNTKIDKAAGATVYLIIDTKDLALNPSSTITYASTVLKTTTDGNGKFTFANFAIGQKPMNVEIRIGDWETTRTLSATQTDVHVFKANSAIVNVFATGAFIQDFTLN